MAAEHGQEDRRIDEVVLSSTAPSRPSSSKGASFTRERSWVKFECLNEASPRWPSSWAAQQRFGSTAAAFSTAELDLLQSFR